MNALRSILISAKKCNIKIIGRDNRITRLTLYFTISLSQLFFWRECSLPSAQLLWFLKNLSSKYRNENSVHLGYLIKTYLYAVLFVFLLFFRQSFVSVAESVHCTDVKGKRFSGWILSVGGRFSPKRLAAWPFHFQKSLY